MPILKSRIDKSSETYSENRRAMLDLIDQIQELEQKVLINSERSRQKLEQRGQILPRDRLERLLDSDTSFLEMSKLAGYRMHDDDGDENISGGCVCT